MNPDISHDWTELWFMCLKCEKLFSQNHELANHMRICGHVYSPEESETSILQVNDSAMDQFNEHFPIPVTDPLDIDFEEPFQQVAFSSSEKQDDSDCEIETEIEIENFKAIEIIEIIDESSAIPPTDTVTENVIQSNSSLSANNTLGKLKAKKKIDTGGDFRCRYCFKSDFKTSKQLRSHISSHKKKNELHKCYFCSQEVLRFQNLVLHMRLHSKEVPYVCEYCAKSFISLGALNLHTCTKMIFVNTSNKPRQYVPNFLETETMDETDEIPHYIQSQLNSDHLQETAATTTTHTVEPQNYQDNFEDSSDNFIHASDYEDEPEIIETVNEIITPETDPYSLNCNICKRTFARPDNLRQHLKGKKHKTKYLNSKVKKVKVKLEQGTNQISFLCTQCGRCFKSKAFLNTHKYLKHVSKPPNECKICNKQFSTSAILKNHLNFSQSHSLNVALLQNSEKAIPIVVPIEPINSSIPFCKLCNKTYSSFVGLHRHNNAMHMDDQLYKYVEKSLNASASLKCPECGKVFLSHTSLKAHMPIHTDEFKCSKCELRCRDSYDLTRHTKLHKNGKNKPRRRRVSGNHSFSQEQKEDNSDEPVVVAFILSSFKCSTCLIYFATKELHSKHLASQSHQNEFFKSKAKSVKIKIESNREGYMLEETIRCDICGKTYKNKNSLSFHKYCEHSKTRIRPHCDVCNRTFKIPSNYRHHLLTEKHKKAELGQSQEIITKSPPKKKQRKNFSVASNVQEISQSMEIDESSIFPDSLAEQLVNQDDLTCHICNRSYHSKYSLKQHMPVHTDEFKCHICNNHSRDAHDLRNHLARAHKVNIAKGGSRKKKKKGKIVRNRTHHVNSFQQSSLNSNVVITSPIENGSNANFRSNSEVQSIIPENAKSLLKCFTCNKTFDSIFKLYSHKTTHTTNLVASSSKNQKRETSLFSCKLCPKQFDARQKLNGHMSAHSSMLRKSKYCDKCDIRFSSPSKLESHLATRNSRKHIMQGKRNY